MYRFFSRERRRRRGVPRPREREIFLRFIMKTGILTFHCAHNYGAVLQAYALQEFLKSLGHEVEVIDYRPEYLTAGYGAFLFPRLAGASLVRKALRLGLWGLRLPRSLSLIPMRVRRRAGFEKFISGRMNLSRERFAEGGRVPAERFDAIVFGSDQIWSPNHTDGGDPVFLGDFPAPAGTLKIAYAASAGAASATLGENPVFADALKNFDAVSVREENLAESLRPKTSLEIETVLDPTMLVDKSVWEKIAEPPSIKEKYVLIYQVAYGPDADRIARELAVRLGAKVVSLASYRFRRGMLNEETPEQFVGWFKHASCVVTTSFHGTAFSLIFGRPLYYVGSGQPGENRPKQILRALGLESRYLLSGSPCPEFSEIDYEDVNKMGGGIPALQARSRAFLERALSLRKTP